MSELFTATAKPSGYSLPARVAVIVAHADDETLGLGGQLARIAALSLIHVTDSAPRDLTDAQRAGFSSRQEYKDARARELERALLALGVGSARRLALGVVDQESPEHLLDLVRTIESELAAVEAVVSHPYEGGHPDHDACAFIVQAACALLESQGRSAPRRLEFASYHARRGGVARGVFWADACCPEIVLPLEGQELARKRAAIAQYVTQAALLAAFPIEIERLRPAPWYDFTQPPPPHSVLYDELGWPMNSALWRERARAALAALQLSPGARPP